MRVPTPRRPPSGGSSRACVAAPRGTLRRIRQRRRAIASTTLRLTGAAVAAYVVALVLLPGTVPVLAPLTALLVVEITLFDMLTSGMQRVISVMAGVILAVALSALVGLTWWSLGLLIAASIVIGQLLRLGVHALEVPISGMLVLAVNGSEVVAMSRIVETIIGALVGVGVNLLFPPRIRANKAATAVGDFADDIANLLRTAASEMRSGVDTTLADQWLDEARVLTRHVAKVDSALEQAERSRRLNPRALRHADSGPSLRAGLEALEHSAIAARSMFRTISDNVPDPALVTAGGSVIQDGPAAGRRGRTSGSPSPRCSPTSPWPSGHSATWCAPRLTTTPTTRSGAPLPRCRRWTRRARRSSNCGWPTRTTSRSGR